MSTLLKSKFSQPVLVLEELLAMGITLLTPEEFSRIFHSSQKQTKYFLETYTKKNLFTRLKKGLYALKSQMPSEEEIANALYRPSYISFEYALAKYGIIPEMPYTITSATTRATANFAVRGVDFSYSKIKKQAFTGYIPIKESGRVILIAEPEKAVADYLYFASLGKTQPNDRTNIKKLNKKKISQYGRLFKRPGLMKLIENL